MVIVGAGPAGIGLAYTFLHFGIRNFTLLERHHVGATFDRWPAEMRFITPSFNSNQFGWLDLNSFGLRLSPALNLNTEHPSGAEYAGYLRAVARFLKLPVQEGVDVRAVHKKRKRFQLDTSAGPIRARFVVWAAGEFQYPRLDTFPGAELCVHNAHVDSWSNVKGDNLVVIGGYESGIDAAIHLAGRRKKVTVLAEQPTWLEEEEDPSVSLSPFTHDRLTKTREKHGKRLTLKSAKVTEVEQRGARYLVKTEDGESLRTSQPPILATGFTSSLVLIEDLFDWEDGKPGLTEDDESSRTTGLFLVGPQVWHDKVIFCFIYKFRQRFGIVANAIAGHLGLDTTKIVATYRRKGMYLDDLSCCKESCHSC